jgi:hypothetical protein
MCGKALTKWQGLEQFMFKIAHLSVGFRYHPRRSTLKHMQLLYFWGDGRDNLYGTGTRANDGHGFIGQIKVMVPFGGVEHLTLKIMQPFNVGQRGLAQPTRAGNHHWAGIGFATGSVHRPRGSSIIKNCLYYIGIETEMGVDAMLFGTMLHVVQNFFLRAELPTPIGVRLKRKGI